jgi:predicted DNA-binding protein
MSKSKTINVRVSQELYDRLEAYKTRNALRRISESVRDILNEGFAVIGQRSPSYQRD